MNTADIEIHLLRCFHALMDERSVSRAAQRMNVSQPAMSVALRRLRQLFRDQLLVRARNEMVPTPRAIALWSVVRGVLAELEKLSASSVPFDAASISAQFTFTIPAYISYVLLPDLMQRLEKAAPGVAVVTRAPNRERAVEWLEKGEIDFRIGWIREPPPILRSRILYKDRFVCLARRGHRAIRKQLTAEELCSIDHVTVDRKSDSGYAIHQAIKAVGLNVRVKLLVQDMLIVPYIVASSNLIAIVPGRLAWQFVKQLPLELFPVPLALPELEIALYWHQRTHHDAASEWMRTMIAEVASRPDAASARQR